MKIYPHFKRFLVFGWLAVLVGGAAPAFSQIPGATDKTPGGLNAAMIKLFGSNTNFIAKTDVRVLDSNQKETTSMVMGFEMLAGKMRVDINMAEVKSKEMSPEFAASMKQMGMDQMATILLPDKKVALTIYPGLKSYAEIPTPMPDYKVEKTRVGKETIDGHPCEKYNVTITGDKGEKQQATAWEATDLKGFPVQMEFPSDDATLIMKFKNIKLGRPETSDFAAPAGMKKYDDVSALLSDAVTRKMGAGNPK